MSPRLRPLRRLSLVASVVLLTACSSSEQETTTMVTPEPTRSTAPSTSPAPYCPAFPGRFGSLADARAFCETFFAYYNHEHRHSGIGLHTPASVHYGTATQVRAQRAVTLDAAYAVHPDRFRRRPVPPKLPDAAWINQPSREALIQSN